MSDGGRKTTTEQKEITGAWMVTFSDLIMLMLTFFVLLLSMSSMNQKSLRELFSHLQESTGILEFSGYGEMQSLAKVIDRYNKTESKIVVDQNRFTNMLIPTEEILEKIRKDTKDLEERIDIRDDERGVVLSFQEDIMFGPGDATIRKESYPFLDSIADTIADSANDVLVMGHTDDMPLGNGTYASNWELSTYRGLAVLDYFLTAKHLDPERFGVGGYGPSRPRYPNDNPNNRSRNRRVEIIFKHLGDV